MYTKAPPDWAGSRNGEHLITRHSVAALAANPNAVPFKQLAYVRRVARYGDRIPSAPVIGDADASVTAERLYNAAIRSGLASPDPGLAGLFDSITSAFSDISGAFSNITSNPIVSSILNPVMAIPKILGNTIGINLPGISEQLKIGGTLAAVKAGVPAPVVKAITGGSQPAAAPTAGGGYSLNMPAGGGVMAASASTDTMGFDIPTQIATLQTQGQALQEKIKGFQSTLDFANQQWNQTHFGGQTPSQFATYIGGVNAQMAAAQQQLNSIIIQIQQLQTAQPQAAAAAPAPSASPIAPAMAAGTPGAPAPATIAGVLSNPATLIALAGLVLSLRKK